jgi:FkbM family methyltransferase
VALAEGRAEVPEATWLHVAVADRQEDRWLFLSGNSPHNSLWAANVVSDAGRVQVPSVTLDQLLERLSVPPSRVDVIKMDVQGAEVAVLAGATALLAAQHAVWVLEVWGHGLEAAGSSVAALIEALQAAELVPVAFQPDAYTPEDAWAEIRRGASAVSQHGSIDIMVQPARAARGLAAAMAQRDPPPRVGVRAR